MLPGGMGGEPHLLRVRRGFLEEEADDSIAIPVYLESFVIVRFLKQLTML